MKFDEVNIQSVDPLITHLNEKIQTKYIDYATKHIIDLCNIYNSFYRKKYDSISYNASKFVIPLTFRYVNGKLWTDYPLHFISKYESDFAFFTFSPNGKRYQYALTPYEGDTVNGEKITYFDVEESTKFAAQMECFKQSFTVHNVDQLQQVLPYYYKYCIKKVVVDIPNPNNIDLFKILKYDIQD